MFNTFIDSNGNVQYIPTVNTYSQLPIINPMINQMINPIINPIINPFYISDNDSEKSPLSYTSGPLILNTKSNLDVNDDPELRIRVTNYFYNKYHNIWLPFSFVKLQKYLINDNDEIKFIKNIDEFEQKKENNDDKVEYIIKNIFGKHEMVKFLDRFVRKRNVNWYDLRTKHADIIKSELYDKLKNHMKKIILEKL
jgi:protoporphyrinogen oxidase